MGDKEAEERFGVDRHCLGECLHVALRKGCDSKPTSLAWNIINILDREAWGSYLDAVWAGLATCQAAREIPAMLKRVGCDLTGGNAGRNALRLAFEFFDDLDWRGYASYFAYEPDEMDGWRDLMQPQP